MELWGILNGLKLVQRRGYDQVIIHSDSLEVVKSILGSSSIEQNQVADCLAKQALIEKDNSQVLDIPPVMALTFIDREKFTGVTFAQ
ncbi:hypothetical protein Golax_024241, partial [Gossypium laxum]|nr:hypothetical protein [Gossypium laxum]